MNLGLRWGKKKTKARIDATRRSTGSQTLADDLPRRKHTPDVQTHACETWRGAVRAIQRVRLSQLRVIHKALPPQPERDGGGIEGGKGDRCQLRLPDRSVGKLRRICQIQARSLSRTLPAPSHTRSHTPPRLSTNEDRVRSASGEPARDKSSSAAASPVSRAQTKWPIRIKTAAGRFDSDGFRPAASLAAMSHDATVPLKSGNVSRSSQFSLTPSGTNCVRFVSAATIDTWRRRWR